MLYDEGGSQYGFAVRLNGSTLQAAVSSTSVVSTVSLTGIVATVRYFATVTFEGRNGNPGVLGLYCALAPLSTPTRPARSDPYRPICLWSGEQ